MRFAGVLLAASVCISAAAKEDVPAAETPVTAETVTPPDVIEAAKKQIELLNADDFDVREAAKRSLLKMDLSLLPWLRKVLEVGIGKVDHETRSALQDAVKALAERDLQARINYGSPVKLDLKAVNAAAVFEALKAQTNNAPLNGFFAYFKDSDKRDFAYSGNYWGAIAKLHEVFNPALPDEREPVTLQAISFDSTLPAKRDYNDFVFWGPRTGFSMGGILALRIIRSALEHDASGDRLTFYVVPHFEGRFKCNSLTLHLDSVILGEQRLSPPDESAVLFEPLPLNEKKVIAEFSIPVKENVKQAAGATLNFSSDAIVVEFKRIRQKIAPDVKYKLPDDLTLTTDNWETNSLELHLSGKGLPPADLSAQALEIEFYDKKGNRVAASCSRSSDTYENGWLKKIGFKFKGSIAAVELLVPAGQFKFTRTIVIDNAPLPFGGAAPASTEPRK